MAIYSVHYYCSECGYEHPLGISVILGDGPAGKASLGDFYAGKDKTLDEALKITRDDVANELGGLPAIKMHCSNLAADALREAIKEYRSKKKT